VTGIVVDCGELPVLEVTVIVQAPTASGTIGTTVEVSVPSKLEPVNAMLLVKPDHSSRYGAGDKQVVGENRAVVPAGTTVCVTVMLGSEVGRPFAPVSDSVTAAGEATIGPADGVGVAAGVGEPPPELQAGNAAAAIVAANTYVSLMRVTPFAGANGRSFSRFSALQPDPRKDRYGGTDLDMVRMAAGDRVTITGSGLSRAIFSAILPRKNRSRPRRPWVPMTIAATP
jgi:hypothetical protein